MSEQQTHGAAPEQGGAPADAHHTDPHGPESAGEESHAEQLHVDKYEGAWMRMSLVVLVIFFIAITVSAFSVGFQVPGVYQRVDPAELFVEGSPWAQPQLRELAPGKYEVYVRAQIWSFAPNEIRIPTGSTVTFYMTSQDVQHGVKITNTNINMMILPGQVSTLTATFDKPGEHHFICHEYCGQLHHTMYGRIFVEDPVQTEAAASVN